MKLSELLVFDDIVIQCHDNPDADALASGYALYWYLEKMGKNPRFIYRGRNEITKGNLNLMLRFFKIPVSYEPDFDEVPELLVTVDCQYGQGNVTRTEAGNIAIIDHHQKTVDLPPMSEVRSNIGSCSTILWDMIRQEGIDIGDDRNLATALYYGLYTDTNRLTEMSHPLDRDMIDMLIINKSNVTEMSNSNISLEELKITGKAIQGYVYHDDYRYLVLKADQCDPNILGVMSDFAMETTDVDVCLAYYKSPEEVKYSVRSCIKEVHANEVAAWLSNGIGGGGGHLTKAGGVVRPELLDASGLLNDEIKDIDQLFVKRLDEYFNMYEIIYAQTDTVDTADYNLYEKRPQEVGCLKLSDVYPVHSVVEIRTLEGDINVIIGSDTYLMVGTEGEVYPITREKLEKSYSKSDKVYDKVFDYEPTIKNSQTGEKKKILGYVSTVISNGGARIYAAPLDHPVKLFTAWDDEKYYAGRPGDYIAVREDDEHDIYIISGKLFDKLYKKV
ncbi:MAG: DHH family phosphoesterase [Eubacterium sp.]|nr:DHH family phosphoesterase [Eubacterium sp.]